VADFVAVTENAHFDGAVRVRGPFGIGVVAKAVLGAQLAIDLVEDGIEFLRSVGEKHGAAGSVGDGFEGVLAGGIAAAFVFYGTYDNRVEQCARAHGAFAGRVEIAAAGGFAAVRDEDDDAAAVVAAPFESARTEENGVVDRSAGALGNFAHGGLQDGNVVGEGGKLGDVFVEVENGETVARPEHLADKMRSGFLLKGDFLAGAEAGVNHKGQVERLLGLSFEDFDFLEDAFFIEFEGINRQVGGGTIVVIEDAGEDVDEIDVNLDFAALGRCVF